MKDFNNNYNYNIADIDKRAKKFTNIFLFKYLSSWIETFMWVILVITYSLLLYCFRNFINNDLSIDWLLPLFLPYVFSLYTIIAWILVSKKWRKIYYKVKEYIFFEEDNDETVNKFLDEWYSKMRKFSIICKIFDKYLKNRFAYKEDYVFMYRNRINNI